ncbi:hypothetical protein ERJ75_001670700 [Trypanosoma vivax]|nr:hypothetical protein ERJ75_001670700 [Trypanosoma vivax]
MNYLSRALNRNSLDGIGVVCEDSAIVLSSSGGNGALEQQMATQRTNRVDEKSLVQLHSCRKYTRRNTQEEEMPVIKTINDTGKTGRESEHVLNGRDTYSFRYTTNTSRVDVECFGPWFSQYSSGVLRESNAPERTGPFDGDILSIILLYVAIDMREILQVSHTCRYWRFYANYAPHWTYYHRLDWGRQLIQLPGYLRRMVGRPKEVTRDEYFRQQRRVREIQQHEAIRGSGRHLKWCIAVSILTAAVCTGNFAASYFLGIVLSNQMSDGALASVVFVVMGLVVFLEGALVITPLGDAATPSKKHKMLRLLSWGAFLLLSGCVLGTMTALTMARAKSAGQVLGSPVIDLVQNEECDVVDLSTTPAFVRLPAALSDIRWRPLTADVEEKTFMPHCVTYAHKEMCFVLLFFDKLYQSSVFNNSTLGDAIEAHVTRSALGFDPFNVSGGAWCAKAGRPQVIAVTRPVYMRIVSEQEQLFPRDVYTNPAARSSELETLTYHGSVNYPRLVTEDPPGSSNAWYESGTPWRRHYIPLVTDIKNTRSHFQDEYRHYVHYAWVCYLSAGVLWSVILVLQCVMQDNPLFVLGAATTITLVFMNPIVLTLAGVLCVKVSDYYFMCSNRAGGAMIGSGIFLTALVLACYVCFR